MDLMTVSPITYADGKIVNGWTSVIWVERYGSPGEVTITTPPDPEIQSALWPGTMVTHIDTETIMMIETHTIDESKEGEPEVVMTGRTVDVIAMENRILTMEDPGFISFINGFSEQDFAYDMVADSSWNQAVKIIDNFCVASIINPYETYPNLKVYSTVTDTEPYPEAQRFELGKRVDSAVYDLLNSTNKGLRLKRPKTTSGSNKLEFIVHQGQDRRNTIQFDWAFGDVEKARYMWSSKDYRNGGYVFTEHFTKRFGRNLVRSIFGVLYQDGIEAKGWDLRMMSLKVDWNLEVLPPVSELEKNYIGAILGVHGRQELAKRRHMILIDATIASGCRYEYIQDYNIGDIVKVRGNYGVDMDMRVVEFAVTADKDGEYSLPTLEVYLPAAY